MRLTTLGLAAASGAGLYAGLVTGAVTLNLGVGRRVRRLGPIEVHIDAPRDTVYAVVTAPYAERRPSAMAKKVEILERTEHMVLAAHFTPVRGGLTATTTETVTFDPPRQVGFRLMRGPVPHVSETFDLTEPEPERTVLRYDGELGTDLWGLGERWGDLVAPTWERTVADSLAEVRVEAERRAAV